MRMPRSVSLAHSLLVTQKFLESTSVRDQIERLTGDDSKQVVQGACNGKALIDADQAQTFGDAIPPALDLTRSQRAAEIALAMNLYSADNSHMAAQEAASFLVCRCAEG